MQPLAITISKRFIIYVTGRDEPKLPVSHVLIQVTYQAQTAWRNVILQCLCMIQMLKIPITCQRIVSQHQAIIYITAQIHWMESNSSKLSSRQMDAAQQPQRPHATYPHPTVPHSAQPPPSSLPQTPTADCTRAPKCLYNIVCVQNGVILFS